jgi:hypothetical protein
MTSQETSGGAESDFPFVLSRLSPIVRIALAGSDVRTATRGVETVRAARKVLRNESTDADTGDLLSWP